MKRFNLRPWMLAPVVGVSLWITGCNSEGTKQLETPQPLFVSHLQLEASDHYFAKREYVGRIQSNQQAQLGAELGGKVNAIHVDIGDTVTKGQPLLTLDTALLQSAGHELSAQRQQLLAQRKLTRANLKRQQALKKKGFAAEVDLDVLVSELNSLNANLQQVAAAFEANQLQQEKSTLKAPYDGVIAQRFVSVGDVINTGQASFSLLAQQQREAQIGIPMKHLAEIQQQQQWPIRVGDTIYQGKLINPGAEVNAQSHTVMLRFTLPADASLMRGELAYLQLQQRHQSEGFWIPMTALTDGMRGVWNVYALNPSGDDYEVVRRSVELIYMKDELAFVQGAVHHQEKLIDTGLHRVVPGQLVRLVQESK
ncbi:Multidrug resistance protein MdtA [Vibrio stylophorae]|uniref:Multidrug resistance protein MdtA n=1 Tax=Vibrio stylophorae TaxID=659351 RepID=A0ABN8DQF4_9VIBR|nr:efflux RND transporter periplasmic adaptor subunit [Vibrio stylophorae]CAH0533409.1 Multidrug resistance protein MdtA [Vibrio stylophorae]